MKTILTILLFTGIATAQISVSQKFIDDSDAAFREVVALRSANTALEASAKAEKARGDALSLLSESRAEFITLLKADNADLRKLKCDSTSFFFVIKVKRCK